MVGLNWLAVIHQSGMNGILADEMVSYGMDFVSRFSILKFEIFKLFTGSRKNDSDNCLSGLPERDKATRKYSLNCSSFINARQLGQ